MAKIPATRKKLSEAPTPKSKAAVATETKKISLGKNGKTAAPAPVVTTAKKVAKAPEPTKKYVAGAFKVDSPEFYKLFPEVKPLIARLRKEGYDNFYMFLSFTPAGVTNPKVKRIGQEMKYNAAKDAK